MEESIDGNKKVLKPKKPKSPFIELKCLPEKAYKESLRKQRKLIRKY